MSLTLPDMSQKAARAVVPLFVFGIGITVAGVALQMAQNAGLIGAQQLLGDTTIFGLLSKVGGIAMIAGMICGALRPKGDGGQSAQQPLDVPMSARVRPAADLIRPTRIARKPVAD